MSGKSKSRNARDGRTAFHTNLRIEPSGDGWKVTEPASDQELFGRGQTPPEAVKNYAELIANDDQHE